MKIEENKNIQLFQSQEIRTQWDNEKELWYFSVIDAIVVLTHSDRPRKYWSDLKSKLKKEGSEVSEKIGQLKLKASDGKMRLTDVANTEQLLRLIQSVPSPNAEPFKIWLAKVEYEELYSAMFESLLAGIVTNKVKIISTIPFVNNILKPKI